MTVTHVVGVDPGLVHTGVVRMIFQSRDKKIEVSHTVIDGVEPKAVAEAYDWVTDDQVFWRPNYVFIEGYKPRSNLNSDRRMLDGVTRFRTTLPCTKVLDNMGVKKIVKKSLMDLLGVWSFTTVTHHQDLRSAARIALLGMLKDPDLNRLLADVVRDHLNGSDWRVV